MAVGDKRTSRLRWTKLGVFLASATASFLLAAYLYVGESVSLITCLCIWLLSVALTIILVELVFRSHERLECQLQSEISKHRMTERALNEGQSQLTGLFNKTPALVFATDRVGYITMFGGEGLESLSLTVDTPLGQRLWDVLPDSPELADAVRRSLGGEADLSRTFDLGNLLFHIRCSPSRDDSGVVTGAICIVTDVTGEVLTRERQLQAVVTGAPIVVFTTDLRGMITSTIGPVHPESALPILAVGDSVIDVFVEADDFAEKFHSSLTGQPVTAEIEIANHTLGIQLSPTLADDGAVIGVTGVTTDLTKQERTRRFFNTLNQTARFMDQAATPDEVHDAAARALTHMGLTCWVLLTDETQETLHAKHLGCSDMAAKALENLTGYAIEEAAISVQACQACSRTIWQKQTSYVSDAVGLLDQLLPKEFEGQAAVIAHILDLNRAILAPLVVDGAVMGIIAVASQSLIPEDIPAITAFAHQMSAAWYRTVLMQDIEINMSDLQAAEESLEHNELYFQALIENTSDILIVIQGDGCIRYANPIAEHMLEDESGSITDQNLMDSIQPEDRDEFVSRVARMLQSHTDSISIRFRLRHSAGDYRTVEGTVRNLQDDPAVGGIVINGHDITYRLDNERRNAEEARLRNALSESTTGLVQLSTEDRIYPFIGEQVSKALFKCAVLVNSYDVSSSMLRIESIVVPGEDAADLWTLLRSMRFTLPGSAMTRSDLMSGKLAPITGGLRSIYDAGFPAALHDRIERQLPDSKTYTVGLTSDDHLLGAVVVVSATPMTASLTHYIEVFARQASITLQRAGAEATLRDYNVRLVKSHNDLSTRVADLEAIHQISIALASHRESQTVLQMIVEQVLELLDVESCSILLPDEDSGDLLFQAATHDIVGMHVPAGQGIASRVLEDGKPRIVQHVESDPDHYAGVSVESGIPVRSLLAIPLAIKGQTIGVLEAINKRRGTFSDNDCDLIVTMANHAAIALENARLYEAHTEQLKYQEQAEGALRNRENRYRSIVDNQAELISRSLTDDKLVFVNDAYCRYFGKSAEELLDHHATPSMPGDDLVRVLRLRNSLGPDRPLVSYTHAIVTPGGESRWVHWTTRAIFDEDKNVVEYQSVGRDVTAEHQDAENLKRQVQYERLISEVYSIACHMTQESMATGITQALRYIGEFTGSDWGFLIMLRGSCVPDNNTRHNTEDIPQIQNIYEWLVEGAPSIAELLEDRSLTEFPWWLKQLQDRDSVEVATVTELPAEAATEVEFWSTLGIRSLVTVPLKPAGALTSVIGLASTFADGEVMGKQAVLLRDSGEILTSTIRGIAEHAHLRTLVNEGGQRCIRAIGLMHEKLECAGGLAIVRLDSYLKALTDELIHSFEAPPVTVSCELNIDDIDLPPNRIILCGMIVNELVSNSLQHAFTEPGEGKIWVDAHLDRGEVALTVRDSGKGLPANLDIAREASLGISLVRTLTQRLGGTMTFNGSQGAEFKIRFPT